MTSIEISVAKHGERIDAIEACMLRQNGRLERIEEKLDRLYMWIVALLGGVVASLVLLVVNMGVGR